MPPNVVKTKREERLWEKAKDIAKEQGHAEQYAYIMGIFKKMLPDRFGKEAAFSYQGWSRGDVDALATLQEATRRQSKSERDQGVPLNTLRIPQRSLWRLVHVHEVAEYVGEGALKDRIKLNTFGWVDTSKLARSEHRPGDVWRTDGGKWRAMPRGEGEAKSFDDKEQAAAYAKGKGQSDAPRDDEKLRKDLRDYTKAVQKAFHKDLSKKERHALQELGLALSNLSSVYGTQKDLNRANQVVDQILSGDIYAGFFRGKWKKLKGLLKERENTMKSASMARRVAAKWIRKEADSNALYKAFKAEMRNARPISWSDLADLRERKEILTRDIQARLDTCHLLLKKMGSMTLLVPHKGGIGDRMDPRFYFPLRMLATELAAILENLGKIEQ